MRITESQSPAAPTDSTYTKTNDARALRCAIIVPRGIVACHGRSGAIQVADAPRLGP